MLNKIQIDPLIDKFAHHCSDEYSLKTDRKQQILDFITGATDQLPDMMSNSLVRPYYTLDILEKLAKKERNDSFYRAASLLIYLSNNWSDHYYGSWNIFELCFQDSAKFILLSSSAKSWQERRIQGITALRFITKYAGEDKVLQAIETLLNRSDLLVQSPGKKKRNQVARMDYAVQLLLLLNMYKEVSAEYVDSISRQLPTMLQAVLTQDVEQLHTELHQTLKLLLSAHLPQNDNSSALDLKKEFLNTKREAIWNKLFPKESLHSSESMKRETLYRELTYVHTALFYTLNLAGSKQNLLNQPSQIGTMLLETIRSLHEVLPLEIRYELTRWERQNVNYQALLEGIVPVDEPYELIELIQKQMNYYWVSWVTLENAITAEPERSMRAFEITKSSRAQALIYKALMHAGQIEYDSAAIEQLVIQLLENKQEGTAIGYKLAEYLKGEIELDSIHNDQQIRSLWKEDNRNPQVRNLMHAISYLPVESQFMRRFLIAITQPEIELTPILSNLYRSPYFKGSQVLEQYRDDVEVNTSDLLHSMLQLQGASDYRYISIPQPEYSNIVKGHMAESIAYYSKLPTDGRMAVIETVFEKQDQLQIEQLADALRFGLGDSSKKIAGYARKELIQFANGELYAAIYTREKKANIKELILDVLRSLDDARTIYNQLLSKEKSEAFRSLIEVLLDTIGQSPEIAHAALANKADPKKLTRIQWLPLDQLPELIHINGHKLDEGVKRYLLLQSLDFTTAPNERLEEVKQYTSASSLADFSIELIQLWLQHGAPAKEKWVLYLAAMFGDHRLLGLLGDQIQEWTDNSRGAIAAEAVRVLAYLNDTSSLMLIDRLSRTIKNRQVKTAAIESLQLAAENMNLTPEQLADRLVTALGLDARGEMELSYGERTFTVKVSSNLQLTVINQENGKVVKSLPAAAQKDDAAQVKKAKATFTQIKKDLKSMVTLQEQRLEESLSKRRLWTQEEWTSLFVDNIIMRQFAIGLIWGVYEADELQVTFRYMEDGTFNTVDEEEYELHADAQIGLIHPLELDEQLINDWKSQLDDYEIAQPFNQLTRPIYLPDEKELQVREWTSLPQEEYSPTAFPKAMERYGWYKGEAQDAGFYYELYKQYDGMIAELQFSGTSISYYEGMDDITLEGLRFHKFTGTPGRYHQFAPEKAQLLVNVPERIFSETVYDILRAAGQAE